MSEVKTNKISSLASNNNITIDPDGTGKVAFSSDITMTSDDPTITMTDSSGTNDIATIQATSGALIITARDGSADGEIIFKKTDGSTTDETMRVDSTGKLLIGTTSQLFGQGVLQVKSNGAENIARFQAAANGESIVFENASGSSVGFIQVNASATSFSTSSDYRLKTQVTYDWDATTRLKQLKPARFKWIADGDDAEFVDGFIAHELTAVPDAISGKGKDAVDDDGNPVLQGVDQSKLVPLLVKTRIELDARITALEAE